MSDDRWSRLADYVVSRRKALGYTRQVDLVHVSALGMRTLSSIEAGERTQYNRSTLAALEQALEWRPGSVEAILDGGEPAPAAPDTTETEPQIKNLRAEGYIPPELRTEMERDVWRAMTRAEMTAADKWDVIRLGRVIWEERSETP